jgi:hypothetical protein
VTAYPVRWLRAFPLPHPLFILSSLCANGRLIGYHTIPSVIEFDILVAIIMSYQLRAEHQLKKTFKNRGDRDDDYDFGSLDIENHRNASNHTRGTRR